MLKNEPCRDQVTALLDVEVTALKLNTGAPCSSHAGVFETWPGDEKHVRQWFVLANGQAVAINEDPECGASCAVIAYS